MQLQFYITLDHDEIQKDIPYRLIAETTRRSVWDTGKRRRLFDQEFDTFERGACLSIIAQAKAWEKNGAPEKTSLSVFTLSLWERLADFCAQLN